MTKEKAHLITASNWDEMMHTPRCTAGKLDKRLYETFKDVFGVVQQKTFQTIGEFHQHMLATYSVMGAVNPGGFSGSVRQLAAVNGWVLPEISECICTKVDVKKFGLIYSPNDLTRYYLIGQDCLKRFGFKMIHSCLRCGTRVGKKDSVYCPKCTETLNNERLTVARGFINGHIVEGERLYDEFLSQHPVETFYHKAKNGTSLDDCSGCNITFRTHFLTTPPPRPSCVVLNG